MSSSEEPNNTLPPAEVIWYYGQFGKNGLDFLPNGRLGISRRVIVLEGKRLHQNWLSIIFFPPMIFIIISIVTYIIYFLLEILFKRFDPDSHLLIITAFLPSLALTCLVLYLLKPIIAVRRSLSIERDNISNVVYKNGQVAFQATNEFGHMRHCVFFLRTVPEARAIATELAKTKQS